MKIHLKIQILTTFFFFKFVQMNQIKNWSQNLLKNIMLNVIYKCSYDFLKILLKVNYNFMNQFKVCLQNSWTCHSTLEFFYSLFDCFIVHSSHAIEPWKTLVSCLVLIVEFSFVIQFFLFEFCSWNFRCRLLFWMSIS
jgi:hypothetical protein